MGCQCQGKKAISTLEKDKLVTANVLALTPGSVGTTRPGHPSTQASRLGGPRSLGSCGFFFLSFFFPGVSNPPDNRTRGLAF